MNNDILNKEIELMKKKVEIVERENRFFKDQN